MRIVRSVNGASDEPKPSGAPLVHSCASSVSGAADASARARARRRAWLTCVGRPSDGADAVTCSMPFKISETRQSVPLFCTPTTMCVHRPPTTSHVSTVCGALRVHSRLDERAGRQAGKAGTQHNTTHTYTHARTRCNAVASRTASCHCRRAQTACCSRSPSGRCADARSVWRWKSTAERRRPPAQLSAATSGRARLRQSHRCGGALEPHFDRPRIAERNGVWRLPRAKRANQTAHIDADARLANSLRCNRR